MRLNARSSGLILSRFVFIRSVFSVSSQCFCLLCYGHDSDRQPYLFKMTFGFTLEVSRLQIWPGEFGWIRMNFGFYHYPKLKPTRDFTRLNFLYQVKIFPTESLNFCVQHIMDIINWYFDFWYLSVIKKPLFLTVFKWK